MGKLDQSTFGLCLYDVTFNKGDSDVVHHRTMICTPSQVPVTAIAIANGEGDAKNVIAAPVHMAGVEICFRPVSGVMKSIGMTGSMIPFGVFQKHYPMLMNYHDNCGFIKKIGDGPVPEEFKVMCRALSTDYSDGITDGIVVVCRECSMWADYVDGLHTIYEERCTCGGELSALEAASFKAMLKAVGAYDKAMKSKRELVRVSGRTNPYEDDSETVAVYGSGS